MLNREKLFLLDKEGIHILKKFDLRPVKYGTFEWIYTAHPASVIDWKEWWADVRIKIWKIAC